VSAQPTKQLTIVDEPQTGLVAMLERLATNPDVPVDKLERLLAMQERIQGRQAETDFNASMTAAQSEVGRVAPDGNNPQTKSKYATYGKLDKILRPIYVQHGFALSFNTGDAPTADTVRVMCRVSHRGGHSELYKVDMPSDGKGAKGGDVMTKTHATGAAMSYGMRYLLKFIFNVAIGEDDNDGNAPKGESISDEQAANIEALLTEVGADRAKFLAWAGVAKVEHIAAKLYKTCVGQLEKKRKAKAQ